MKGKISGWKIDINVLVYNVLCDILCVLNMVVGNGLGMVFYGDGIGWFNFDIKVMLFVVFGYIFMIGYYYD